MNKIPTIKRHELLIIDTYGGVVNSKEVCKCVSCKELRQRRDNIFKSRGTQLRRLLKLVIN